MGKTLSVKGKRFLILIYRYGALRSAKTAMARKARIRLTSTDYGKLEEVCGELRSIAEKTGVKITGPIPLPTKKLKVPVLKSPCGEGTQTWDKWELRIHKRLIDIDAEDRVMRRIMRIRVPEEVYVSIELV
jgi:small subunit ribosomal protein S10